MQVTVSIHEAWFARPEDLRRVLALLAGLEIPPPGTGTGTAARPVAVAEPHDPREDYEEPFDPEGRALARPSRRYPGDDDRSQATVDDEDPDEDAPTNGRQLLGWAAKQQPDAKGLVMSYGKRNGLKSKIVDWTPDQVEAAYRFARSGPTRSRR
jgi:hypothetical protein